MRKSQCNPFMNSLLYGVTDHRNLYTLATWEAVPCNLLYQQFPCAVYLWSSVDAIDALFLTYLLCISDMASIGYTVVLWSHLLGGVQWWEDPLPWSGPCLTGINAGKWIQNGEAKQCSLQ